MIAILGAVAWLIVDPMKPCAQLVKKW